jgi:hypothetical protein
MQTNLETGEVNLDLAGMSVTLVPSIDAVLNISRRYGGLRNAVLRLLDFDVEALLFVIEAGAGMTGASAKEKKKLHEAVFKTGIQDLNLPAIDFVNTLSNGGRPLTMNEEDREAKNGNPGSE